MKNIKILRFFQSLIMIIVFVTPLYIVYQYDVINDFYTQKKENYADLKKLNYEILDTYQIDLKDNEELNELSRQVNYDEHMINGLEPNTEAAKNYWWILIGVLILFILVNILNKWIEYITEPSENEIKTE